MEQRVTGGERVHRWERRAGLARALRLAVWSTPIAVSTSSVAVASRAVARPAGLGPAACYWIALLTLGTLALWSTERLARRLLPLAAMLQLSLAFPDRAPSRFAVVLRTGNLGRLDGTAGEVGPGVRALRASSTPAEVTAELVDLVRRLHAHDRGTRGHSERVRAYAVLLGEELRLDPDDLDRLQWAALLHDVGKLNVPAELLNVDRELTAGEFDLVKRHPADGAQMVEPLRWWLGPWTDAVGQHHERIDGTGYPLHLSGTDISWSARIVAVADAYDVMTAARSYKPAYDAAVAMTELTRCAGSHFDPVVVRAFLSISIARLQKATGPVAWLANIPIIGSAPLANAAAAVAVGTALLASGPTIPDQVNRGSVALGATTTVTAPPATDPTPATPPVPEAEAVEVVVEDAVAPADGTDEDGTGNSGDDGSDGATTTTRPATPTTVRPQPPVDDLPVPATAVPSTTTTSAPTTTTTAGYRPSGDVVTPESVRVADVTAPVDGSAQTDLLAQSDAVSLIYVSCEAGEATFDGAIDPVTIWPQGETDDYECEFMADRSDGSTVHGTFAVIPS